MNVRRMWGVWALGLCGCLSEPQVTVCAEGVTASACRDAAADARGDVAIDATSDAVSGEPLDVAVPMDARRDLEMGPDGSPVDSLVPDAGDSLVPDARDPEASVDGAPPDAAPDAIPPCEPTLERCNGVDDDCDGDIDEGGLDAQLQLGGRLVREAFLGTKLVVAGDTALLLWIDYTQTPPQLFGRSVNLETGAVSEARQYTRFGEGESGISGHFDAAPYGPNAIVVGWPRTVTVPGALSQRVIEVALIGPDGDGFRPVVAHPVDQRVRALRVRMRGNVIWLFYATAEGLFSVRASMRGESIRSTLTEQGDTNPSVLRKSVGEIRKSYVAWSTVDARGEGGAPGIQLAVIDPDGAVDSNRRVVNGNAADPTLFHVGDHIGLTWVDLTRGAYRVNFELLDAESTRSRLEAPVAVYHDPDRIVAQPHAVGRVEDGGAVTVVIDWLAAPRRGSPDFGMVGQHSMRSVLTETEAGWRTSPAVVQRASASNLIDIELVGAGEQMLSTITDNGFGGGMCHALCDTELATMCQRPPTDVDSIICRPDCRRGEAGLIAPWHLQCLTNLDCDDPNLEAAFNACEEAAAVPPPPQFETIGVHLAVHRFCQPEEVR